MLRAIDSGLKILRALGSIPYAVHRVRFPAAEVFADEKGTQPREVKAVVLESWTTDTDNVGLGVFPTSRIYKPGQYVT
jgi:hypothetical protein